MEMGDPKFAKLKPGAQSDSDEEHETIIVDSSNTVIMSEGGSHRAVTVQGLPSTTYVYDSTVTMGTTIIEKQIVADEVVKASFLCIECESVVHIKRIRCSLVIFLCWTLLVTSMIGVYIGVVVMPEQQAILELDVTFSQFVRKILSNCNKTERLLCSVIVLLVMFCTSLVIYYFLALARTGDPSDEAPNWFVQREVWNAAQFNGSERLGYRPIKMVVIQHSVTPECKTFFACAAAVRELQEVYMTDRGLDVPYNFLIGGDGSVYEGRGWDKVGAHSVRFDKCAIGVGFLGDYRYSEVTKRQINGLKMLLKMGVLGGHLDPNFAMVGASDIRDSLSPGTNLYKAIQEMEHYDHENRYRDMVCEQMHLPEGEEYVDLAPKDWLLTREDWEAAPIKNLESNEQYRPLRLVVINNSQTRHCVTFAACKLELQSVQSFFHNIPVEIAYNFAIGNDGRVYEVRGWGAQPGGNMNDTPCAFNIGFIGDYAYNASIPMVVSDQQRNRTQLLLAEGVRLGHLHPDYIVVGAKDMDPSTTSPGDDLYNEIKTWDRYDHDGVLKDLNCDQIHDLPASSSA